MHNTLYHIYVTVNLEQIGYVVEWNIAEALREPHELLALMQQS